MATVIAFPAKQDNAGILRKVPISKMIGIRLWYHACHKKRMDSIGLTPDMCCPFCGKARPPEDAA